MEGLGRRGAGRGRVSKGLGRLQGPAVSHVGTPCCTVTVSSPPTPRVQDGAPFFLFPQGAHRRIEATAGTGRQTLLA